MNAARYHKTPEGWIHTETGATCTPRLEVLLDEYVALGLDTAQAAVRHTTSERLSPEDRARIVEGLTRRHEGVTFAEAERMEAREALRPFAAVFRAYQNNQLDEVRLDCGPRDDHLTTEMLQGRGGKTLLTLADFARAAQALGNMR